MNDKPPAILLFGKFCAVQPEFLSSGFETSKVQQLLAYLLLNRHRAHHRERLAALLWSDKKSSLAKQYLRKTLWQLQTALAPWEAASGKVNIEANADWIQISPSAILESDVGQFERCYREVRGQAGYELCLEQITNLRRAVALYRGDLLDGHYADWCFFERDRLQQTYLMMIDKLIAYCEANALYEEGLTYANLSLRYEYARERTHRKVMRLYYLSGNRSDALRQYERCVKVLRDKLDVAPNAATDALCTRIRSGKTSATLTDTSVHELPAILSRLMQIETSISDIQQHIRTDISVVEALLTTQASPVVQI